MSYLPEDVLIVFARTAGTLLDPYVAPIHAIINTYIPAPVHSFLIQIKASHSQSLPLMNPIDVLLIIAAYLAIVTVGMALMKNLPRQDAKWLSLYQNTTAVALSAYMMYAILTEAARNGYTLFANRLDESENGVKMSKLIWLFYFSKITEFTDTFIMILKKNNRQISFLHLYHHASIFAIWWLVTYVAPGGEGYFSAAMNSFIHVVMYGYYLFTSFGVKFVSIVKPYITMMQMTQFTLMTVQATYDTYVNFNHGMWSKTQGYPLALSVILLVYMQTMLALFANFFRQDAKRRSAEKKKTAAVAAAIDSSSSGSAGREVKNHPLEKSDSGFAKED
ncbi:very-long-chain 3-oxoacyl-CoA synthase [Synchytrium microbalum]|uniref:Elongation of fatty acids protein n=1 Tax=Synchytrium microbalum TaxID=1806994 RepID=A0A507C3V4_9FUNG|nr:very-long-chain 3-oxoacyl-CoA synthase [Synchytrium microbalum]TPX32203.1 very-long-chain 3-oxoacyl-CoA synthase [Synchytrium microbalum]